MRKAQPVEGVRSEDGRLNLATIVRLAERLTDRSKKRRNSGGTEGSFGGSFPGYDPYPRNSSVYQFLTLDRSQGPEENVRETRVGRRTVYDERTGIILFVPTGNQVAETAIQQEASRVFHPRGSTGSVF